MERLEARLALDASGTLPEFYVCSHDLDHDHDHGHDEELHVESVGHATGLLSLSTDDRIVTAGVSFGTFSGGSLTLANNATGIPELNSLPGAPAAIYLDFDGHGSNLGAYDVDGDPTTFNAAEAATITEAHRQVSVYYAMFNVNVTTVKPDLAKVPTAWIVISNDVPNGQSYVGVFPNTKPESWISSSAARTRASGIAHEIGHNFGLLHQSDYDLLGNRTSEYSNGTDNLHGALMGVDYRQDVNKWTLGHPGNSASALQDDIAVIATAIKSQPGGGDGFRPDDHGGTIATATALTVSAGGRSASGIIERMTDVDMFSFTTTTAGGVVISVVPTRPSGLDAKVEVYDVSGTLLAARDGDANEQQIFLPVGTGTWYVSISSHGNYGDLGMYDLRVNDLPAGWASADIGSTGLLGDARFGAGTYTVAGSGAAVGGTADAFRFAWQQLTGDGSITARVTQNQKTDVWARAGVEIRESLAANSKHVAMVTTASRGPQLLSRATTDGPTTTVDGTTAVFTATWVRLVRVGNVITASRSADGVTWTTVGSVTVEMSSTVYIGLLSSAADATKLNAARFTNVTLTGTINAPETVNGLAAPAGVAVAQGGGASLVVSWQPVAGATDYEIERSENGVDFTGVFTADSSATSWTNVGLAGAMRYFFRVRARNAAGLSAASAIVSGINRPSPVTKAAVTWLSSSQLVLNWIETSGETGYRIERSTDNVTFTQIATVGANVPSYTSGGLAAQTRYWYRISPMSATGDGNPVVITGSTGLQAVIDLAFTSKSSSAIGIEWSAISAATSYRIERSTNGTTFTALATVPGNTLAYTDTTVAGLGKFYYRVVAVNNLFEADPSATIFTAAPAAVALPAPWTAADIGSVTGAGATGWQSPKFVSVSSGTAIGGPADSFRFTYQPLVGDGTIVARVDALENTNGWAKAGVVIRESTDANARQAVMVVSATNGIAWQYRQNVGGSGVVVAGPTTQAAPVWVRVVRAGNTFTGSWSADGSTWTEVGSITISMGSSALAGLASTSAAATRLNRAEFTNVAVSSAAPSVAATGTLSPMSTLLGQPSAAQTVSVTGSGLTAAVVATAPAGFEVAADGVTFGPTAQFAPAGGVVSGTLSVRLAASAPAGSHAGNLALTSTGAAPVTIAIPASTVLQAVGTLAFTSKSSSAIGIEWTAVAAATSYRIERSTNSVTFTTLATVDADTLAYTDDTVAVLGKFYYRVVAVNDLFEDLFETNPSPTIFTAAPAAAALPAPWTAADVGSVAGEGATGLQSGTFIHVSSGTAIGGPADSFRFTYQPLVGDGSIIARVSLQETTGGWAKAGLMIRETNDVNARQAVMVVSPTKGIAWQYRHNIGGNGVTTVAAADQIAPVWLRLVRAGNTFTGFWSSDGVSWIQAGSTTVAMGPNAVIGLVSTSDDASRLNRAEFTNVAMSTGAPAVVATGTLSPMSTLLGQASAAQTVTVAGSGLTAAVIATAPAGFEVATDGVTFGPTAEFAPSGGVVLGTLSVRLAASAVAGSHAGDVALTSAGAAPVSVAIPASTVTDEIVFDVAADQTVTHSLSLSGALKVVKRGTGTLILDAAGGHSGMTSVEAGTLIVAHGDALAASDVHVAAGGTLKVTAGLTMRAPSVTVAGGTLDVTGVDVLVNTATGIGMLAITSGAVTGSPQLTVSGNGVVTLPADRRQVVNLARLTIDQAGGGRLDIGKSRINIAAGGATEAELRADLIAGRGAGAFNGTAGIMTTGGKASPTSPNPVVGYRVFSSGSAIVAWAAFGDVNLDGKVDPTDISLINQGNKFGKGSNTGAVWFHGDFNYSGHVNTADTGLINTAKLYAKGSYLSSLAAMSPSAVSPTTAISQDAWLALAFEAETQQTKKKG